MKRIIAASSFLAFCLFAGSAFAQEAQTQTTVSAVTPPPAITYPVPDLGNCASKEACRVYCNDTAHQAACMSFAQLRGLMSKIDVDRVKTLQALIGPGGCQGPVACKAYCADRSHHDECLLFAKEHNLRPKEVIGNTTPGIGIPQKVGTPEGKPGIGNANLGQMCRAYCASADHREECFPGGSAEERKMLPARPQDMMRKVDDTRPVPPQIQQKYGCTTISECKALCAADSTKCPTQPPQPPSGGLRPTIDTADLGGTVFNAFRLILGI